MAELITIKAQGLADVREQIDKLSLSSPDFEARIKEAIKQVVFDARRKMCEDATSAMKNGDPRHTAEAVRASIYKEIFGGNINILNGRRGRARGGSWQPVRTLRQGQRGGNRRKVSAATKAQYGYSGKDRGYVLRFLNSGTGTRDTKYGNRGSITGSNWFGGKSQVRMEEAAEAIVRIIDNYITEISNGR